MTRIEGRARSVAALTLFLLGSACGGDDPEPGTVGGDVGNPVPGGTAVIMEGADMTIPLSIVAQGTLDGSLGGDVMFMELLRGDWDGGLVFRTADQSPMAMARRYEYFGPDSASIRFHMRSDLRWSDGQPITAEDVVFTYSLVGEPAIASPVQNYVEFLDGVEAENDSTVVFHFDRRYAEMLTHTALAILPQHVFVDTAPADFINHP